LLATNCNFFVAFPNCLGERAGARNPGRPELLGDLTEQDWAVLLPTLESIKRTILSNNDQPPAEIFEIMRKALLEYFRKPELKASRLRK
jgi:hypothetical protein